MELKKLRRRATAGLATIATRRFRKSGIYWLTEPGIVPAQVSAMARNADDLRLRAKRFAIRILKCANGLPRTVAGITVARQLGTSGLFGLSQFSRGLPWPLAR